MMRLLLVVMTTAMAQGAKPAAPCTLDSDGYCTDQVLHYELSFKNKDPSIRINTAWGIGTTIELPPHVKLRSKPDLSNEAMFDIGREKDWEQWQKRRVFDVNPIAPKKAPKGYDLRSLVGKTVRLELALDVGVTLLVRVRIVAPEPEQSVVRLVLGFAELEQQEQWAQRRVKELAGQWQSEYIKRKEKLDAEVAERVPYERARAKLHHNECRELVRSGETDHAIAITDKICREGSTLELHFRVINRSAARAFVVGRVQVSAKPDEGVGYLLRHASAQAQAAQSVVLDQDQQARGIVWWPLSAGRKVQLSISEDVAKGRVVKIDKIEF
jgi:hypothetical protein